MRIGRNRRVRRQRGQSLIEFAFLMPIIFGMVATLREINMAINAAIVNSKYARSTMTFLFFNHRWYPEDGFVQLANNKVMQRWWVGVGNTPVSNEEINTSPQAPAIKVGIGAVGGDDGTGSVGYTAPRQFVRIRSTAFVCLPPRGGSGPEYGIGGMSESTFAAGQGAGNFCSTSF